MYTKGVFLKGGICINGVDSRQGGGGEEKSNHFNNNNKIIIIKMKSMKIITTKIWMDSTHLYEFTGLAVLLVALFIFRLDKTFDPSF